jgi:hypothetical protein
LEVRVAKCGVRDCIGKVIGGFQRLEDVGHFNDPTATILGMKRFWCEHHKGNLTQNLGRGRFLSEEELKEERT